VANDGSKVRVIDLQRNEEKELDSEFVNKTITDATDDYFTTEDGACIPIQEEWDIKPEIGDIARIFYGIGGWSIRGLFINGEECFYRTKQEQLEIESGKSPLSLKYKK